MHQSDNNAYTAKNNIRKRLTASDIRNIHEVKKTLRKNSINTVCENAKCPNLAECFSRSTATFIILGKACTRACSFCAVDSKAPGKVDLQEPYNIARTVKKLSLKHVVITSVTRDDLDDKGISQFIKTVREVKKIAPEASIEILTPDFMDADDESLIRLIKEGPDVFGHNMEMAKRLYPSLRAGSDYDRSLKLLKKIKTCAKNGLMVKSAIMLGIGEDQDEVKALIKDIRTTGCDIIVIGQYLQPSQKHAPVMKYYSDEEFKYYEEYSYSLGFKKVHSFAKARSSYAL